MSKRAKPGESTLAHPSRRSPRRSLSDGERAPLPPPLPPAPGQESHVEVEACEIAERFGDSQYTAKDVLQSVATPPQSAVAEPLSVPAPTLSQSMPSDVASAALIIQALRTRIVELEAGSSGALCAVCHSAFVRPVVSVICWHVCCEQCFLAALGTRGLCPHCTSITMPGDLRRIYF